MLKGLLGHFPSGQGKHNNRSVAFRRIKIVIIH